MLSQKSSASYFEGSEEVLGCSTAEEALGSAPVIEAIKLFLWTHSWWHASLIVVPPLVLSAVIGWRELHHSGIANQLREKANTLTTEGGCPLVRRK
jgi:hypothetical protein